MCKSPTTGTFAGLEFDVAPEITRQLTLFTVISAGGSTIRLHSSGVFAIANVGVRVTICAVSWSHWGSLFEESLPRHDHTGKSKERKLVSVGGDVARKDSPMLLDAGDIDDIIYISPRLQWHWRRVGENSKHAGEGNKKAQTGEHGHRNRRK